MAKLNKTQINTLDSSSKISSRASSAMKKHAQHHTPAHNNSMIKSMSGGSTFTAAHKIALKRVGK